MNSERSFFERWSKVIKEMPMGKRNRELNKGRKEASGNALGGWRPIRSAPKNEPLIFYDEEWEATLGAIQIGSIDDDGSGRTSESEEFKPTHWMPLPEPPTIRR